MVSKSGATPSSGNKPQSQKQRSFPSYKTESTGLPLVPTDPTKSQYECIIDQDQTINSLQGYITPDQVFIPSSTTLSNAILTLPTNHVQYISLRFDSKLNGTQDNYHEVNNQSTSLLTNESSPAQIITSPAHILSPTAIATTVAPLMPTLQQNNVNNEHISTYPSWSTYHTMIPVSPSEIPTRGSPPMSNNKSTTTVTQSHDNDWVRAYTAYMDIPHSSKVYIPKSIKSISKSPTPEKWTFALENEIKSMIEQKVFELTPIDPTTIPPNLIIPSRILFDVRMNADGTINKYKARLVAQGNHQDDSTFFDTFADTASARSINVLLSLAAANSLEISSIDVKTAFLYSLLQEELYLRRPPGLGDDIMPQVVRLNKCIYGLRQAAFAWRQLLNTTLLKLGFTMLQTDNCVYKISKVIKGQAETLFLGVYVDDILCLGSSNIIIHWFRDEFSKSFTITFNQTVSSFLGMQLIIDRPAKTITLEQQGYIDHLISRFNIDTTKVLTFPNTPMSSNDMIDHAPEKLSITEQTLYMQIVGSLLFLSTRSRPDLSYSVNYLTLFMTNATQVHLKLAHRVLQYIYLTRHIKLTFNGSLGTNFYVMVDSSYATHTDRKSHYGYSIHMNNQSGACITVSKKASLLALSSTEAEYIGMFEASKVIMWLRQFLLELNVPLLEPTTMYEDNKSAIQIVQNGNDKGRTKHMDVRYHYIRELVAEKALRVEYMPTTSMVADMLTKALDPKLFLHFRNSLLGNLV
jgi:hypothetical protein